jgi:hypothetical protein
VEANFFQTFEYEQVRRMKNKHDPTLLQTSYLSNEFVKKFIFFSSKNFTQNAFQFLTMTHSGDDPYIVLDPEKHDLSSKGHLTKPLLLLFSVLLHKNEYIPGVLMCQFQYRPTRLSIPGNY